MRYVIYRILYHIHCNDIWYYMVGHRVGHGEGHTESHTVGHGESHMVDHTVGHRVDKGRDPGHMTYDLFIDPGATLISTL